MTGGAISGIMEGDEAVAFPYRFPADSGVFPRLLRKTGDSAVEIANPQLNITANKLAQKWLGEIRSQIGEQSPITQAGCWKVILDRCALRRSARASSLTKDQMVENVENRIKALHEKFASRWKWPSHYAEFSEDCGVSVTAVTEDVALKFGASLRQVINYDRYNLAQLLKLKAKIVDAILTFHGHRRAAFVASDALEGARIADECIAKMEAEIVDMELKGRERFWEKVALSAQEWDARSVA